MWVVVMVELIVGTCFENPPIRLLSMPLATVLFTFGTELLIIDAMRLLGVPNLFRISSLPQGAQQRPGIYNIIEDVVAVDGGGGTDYRRRFSARYEASHIFRRMLHRLTIFWAIGAEAAAVLCTVLIFTLTSGDAAYVIGWTVPFIFAGIWALVTWWYVKRNLLYERTHWNRDGTVDSTDSGGVESGIGPTSSKTTTEVEKLPRPSIQRPERQRTSMSSRPRMSIDQGSRVRPSLDGASSSPRVPSYTRDRTRISLDPGSRPRMSSYALDRTRISMDPDSRPLPESSLQDDIPPVPAMPDRTISAQSAPEMADIRPKPDV